MRVNLTVPELMLIAATRGVLGIGVGLLLAPRLGRAPRKAIGLALLTIGVLSTFPLAKEVFGKKGPALEEYPQSGIAPVG